jgi:hypothetical protein
MLIVQGGKHHSVQQFAITTWKDFEANLNPGLMIDFVRAVRQEAPPGCKHPIVAHCR